MGGRCSLDPQAESASAGGCEVRARVGPGIEVTTVVQGRVGHRRVSVIELGYGADRVVRHLFTAQQVTRHEHLVSLSHPLERSTAPAPDVAECVGRLRQRVAEATPLPHSKVGLVADQRRQIPQATGDARDVAGDDRVARLGRPPGQHGAIDVLPRPAAHDEVQKFRIDRDAHAQPGGAVAMECHRMGVNGDAEHREGLQVDDGRVRIVSDEPGMEA